MAGTIDACTQLSITCFCINWLLCYALWQKAKWCITLKREGNEIGLFTNDVDIDTRLLRVRAGTARSEGGLELDN